MVDSSEVTMIVMILYHLGQPSKSQESLPKTCSMEFDGQCIEKVRFFFGNNLTDKGELFVFYKDQEHEEEVIAQCDWKIGDLHCQQMEAYTCELRLQKYFSISIHKERNCVTSGDFRVDAAYQQPIDCRITDYRKGANDTITQFSGTTDKETFQSQTDISVVVVPVAIVISVLIAVSVATVLIWRNRIIHRGNRSSKNPSTPEHKDEEQNKRFLPP